MKQDAWKRPISSIKNKHYQQRQFNFKPCKSTIEEQEIWNEQELKPWAEKQRKGLSSSCKLYLQAEWSKRELVIPMIIDFVKENKHWAISLQSHKYMNIP